MKTSGLSEKRRSHNLTARKVLLPGSRVPANSQIRRKKIKIKIISPEHKDALSFMYLNSNIFCYYLEGIRGINASARFDLHDFQEVPFHKSRATGRDLGSADASSKEKWQWPCYNEWMKRARKRMTPRKETRRQMQPIRRAAFMDILAKAIKTPFTKPVRKSS